MSKRPFTDARPDADLSKEQQAVIHTARRMLDAAEDNPTLAEVLAIELGRLEEPLLSLGKGYIGGAIDAIVRERS